MTRLFSQTEDLRHNGLLLFILVFKLHKSLCKNESESLFENSKKQTRDKNQNIIYQGHLT